MNLGRSGFSDNVLCVGASSLKVVSKIHEFDQRQLSDTAWSFANCGLWNAQLVSAIESESTAKISTLTSSSLSKISWSMVHWGAQEVVLMDAIAAQTKQNITDSDQSTIVVLGVHLSAFSLCNVRCDKSVLVCVS